MPPSKRKPRIPKALANMPAASRAKVMGARTRDKARGFGKLRYKGLHQLTPLQRQAIMKAQRAAAIANRRRGRRTTRQTTRRKATR